MHAPTVRSDHHTTHNQPKTGYLRVFCTLYSLYLGVQRREGWEMVRTGETHRKQARHGSPSIQPIPRLPPPASQSRLIHYPHPFVQQMVAFYFVGFALDAVDGHVARLVGQGA